LGCRTAQRVVDTGALMKKREDDPYPSALDVERDLPAVAPREEGLVARAGDLLRDVAP
jgi:hypothetical protein